MRRMLYAEAVVVAFLERERSENWVDWTRKNPVKSTMLNDAMRAAGVHSGE